MNIEMGWKQCKKKRGINWVIIKPSSSCLSPLPLESTNALLSPLGSHPLNFELRIDSLSQARSAKRKNKFGLNLLCLVVMRSVLIEEEGGSCGKVKRGIMGFVWGLVSEAEVKGLILRLEGWRLECSSRCMLEGIGFWGVFLHSCITIMLCKPNLFFSHMVSSSHVIWRKLLLFVLV